MSFVRFARSRFARVVAPVALLGTALSARADDLATTATTAITGAQTGINGILAILVAITVAFAVYGLVKKAASK